MQNSKKVKSNPQEALINLTCPICDRKISFTLPREELVKAKSSSGVIKKAINHANQHVIIVHIDEKGNVRRTYGYQCAEIAPAAEITASTRDSASSEDVFGKILAEMEQASKSW